jgi:hypothetical protein
MAGYAKLFTRILDSTIWRESNPTRILWITMLALADRHGYVSCTIPGLADRAKITLEECEYALKRFQEPDKYSWSKDEEGRRIRVVEGGWFLINHEKFRALMSADEVREKTRVRVARYRALHNVTPVTSNSSNDIATASTTTTASRAVEGLKVETNKNKSSRGGGSDEKSKAPPPCKFSQSDFNERDWRKIAVAKKKIAEMLSASVGARKPISDAEYWQMVSEESGVTVSKVMELQKANGGSA